MLDDGESAVFACGGMVMAQLSHSVILVMGFAEAEAHAARHGTIEPAHLLLGLCKMCDLAVKEMMQAAAEAAYTACFSKNDFEKRKGQRRQHNFEDEKRRWFIL